MPMRSIGETAGALPATSLIVALTIGLSNRFQEFCQFPIGVCQRQLDLCGAREATAFIPLRGTRGGGQLQSN